jgi:phosphoribosyl-ATP pyrophosphohydrolase
MEAEDSQIDALLIAYLTSRGIPIPIITTGEKVIGEATELVEAIAEGDEAHIHHELADVVLACAVVARQYGTTVESCIAEKTELDANRGGGRLPDHGVETNPSTYHLGKEDS